jgi:hypothetical protein
MTQMHIESVAEAPAKSDPVAKALQQEEGQASKKGKPCSRCSSCLKCRLASGKEIALAGKKDGQAKSSA